MANVEDVCGMIPSKVLDEKCLQGKPKVNSVNPWAMKEIISYSS
jgi:hypothetical protein